MARPASVTVTITISAAAMMVSTFFVSPASRRLLRDRFELTLQLPGFKAICSHCNQIDFAFFQQLDKLLLVLFVLNFVLSRILVEVIASLLFTVIVLVSGWGALPWR